MKKREWSDKQLEELLGDMPKIKDERDPRDIYQNISRKVNKRKQLAWIMPAAAAVAALFLFFILAPNLMPWQESAEKPMESKLYKSSSSNDIANGLNNADSRESMELKETGEPSIKLAETPGQETDEKISIKAANADFTTAVYEEDLKGKEVLTYAIPDQKVMNVIPVSVLVSPEKGKSKVDLFEENMSKLTEEEWGLSDYYPLNAKLAYNEENRVLTVDVPSDHTYAISSTTEKLLNQVLTSAMHTMDISEIQLTTDGKKGIDFSHYGLMEKFIPDELPGNYAYYFYYPNDSDSKPFIVPYQEKHNSINAALEAMKENREAADLEASIPDDINFETEETPEDKLIIRFSEESEVYNDESTLHTIEAMLLTAKEFNFEAVKIENADADQIGRFDLNAELRLPVAANKRTLP